MNGPRIGEILCEMNACTPEVVRQGLENQVLFGGRLGTNLLEIGGVSEDELARALGRRHGRPCLFGDLKVDPVAVRMLAAEQVEQYEAVPYLVADRKLALLVCDPDNLRTLDEVAFLTGKRVHPIVVPEARIWALMRRFYGIDRHLRGISIEGEPARRRQPAPAPAREEPVADLMDEAEFQALYADRLPESRPAASPEPLDDIVELTEIEEVAPAPPPEAHEAVLASLRVEEAGRPPPARSAAAPPPAAPEPEPSPLGFTDAVRFLGGVRDRQAIARAVLRYARSRFRRAVLLTVHGDVAAGWEGLGEGLDRRALRRARVKLGQPGALETVVSTRAHFLGPLHKTEQNLRLLKALGGGVPRNAFLLPILGLGRVVNVLYADNGRGGVVDGEGLGELLILAAKIAQSYDTLVRRAV